MNRTLDKTLYRELRMLPTDKVDPDTRTCPMSFSSEEPVTQRDAMGPYTEVLSHDPGAMDPTRLNNGAPILINHDPAQQVGAVVPGSVTIDPVTKKGRCIAKFSKSQAGTDAMNDVQDGIRGSTSVGYRVLEHQTTESQDAGGMDQVRVTKWEPLEVSLAGIPADKSVGVGRSVTETSTAQQNKRTMSTTETATATAEANRIQVLNEARSAESTRVREIAAIGIQFPAIKPEEVEKAINDGTTIQVFQRMALERIKAQPIQLDPNAVNERAKIGMNQKEIKRYSILGAIKDRVDNGRSTGFYKECSDAVTNNTVGVDGQRMSPTGFYVPMDVQIGASWGLTEGGRRLRGGSAPSQRFLQSEVNSAGGYTVQTDVLGGSFIEVLRNKQTVIQMGARTLSGLQGNVLIPRQNGAATAYWVGETGQITQTDQVFGFVALQPRKLGSVGGVTKQLLAQASLDAESVVRDDIIQVLAIARDYAALAGTGANNQPVGILNYPGVGSMTWGGTSTWGNVVLNETKVNQANALVGKPGWIISPATMGKFKTNQKATNYPSYLMDSDGMVNGYPVANTNQITATNQSIFGNWDDLIVADWNGLDVVVDPYTQADTSIIRLIIQMWCDVGIRHSLSFVFSTDSAAQ